MKNNLKVLVADSESQFGKDCQKELKKLNFDVVMTKKDGSAVISALESQHIDVVLMDVFMANEDAVDVLEFINSSAAEKPLAVVISSVDSQDFENQMIDAGADYYFIKPVNPQSVAKRISRLSSWKSEVKKRSQALYTDSDMDIVIFRRKVLVLLDSLHHSAEPIDGYRESREYPVCLSEPHGINPPCRRGKIIFPPLVPFGGRVFLCRGSSGFAGDRQGEREIAKLT